MGFLAVGVGLYPFAYFLVDRHFGLLSSKTEALLADLAWNVAFYAHIGPGGVALLIGWMQFHRGLRANRPEWHRRVGWAYATLVLVSGLAGLYLALYATGGWVSGLGFGCLAAFWLFTTGQGDPAVVVAAAHPGLGQFCARLSAGGVAVLGAQPGRGLLAQPPGERLGPKVSQFGLGRPHFANVGVRLRCLNGAEPVCGLA